MMAIILGLAPFYPVPHLFEKLDMLIQGELSRPIDIFDLFWHSWPLILIGFKAFFDLKRRYTKQSGQS
jgi:hypothetical protein